MKGCLTVVVVIVVGVVLLAFLGSLSKSADKSTAPAATGTGDSRVADHVANARDYRAAGQNGLALVELDQALSIDRNDRAAKDLQAAIRTEATSAVRVVQAQGTAAANLKPQLVVLKGWSCRTSASGNFMETQGEIRNVSDRPLRVEVIVTYSTRDGTFVSSGSGYAKFDPILPGQTSPFSTFDRTNPAIGGCNLRFRERPGGRELSWEDG